MADRKISQLSNLSDLSGNEEFVVAKNNDNYKVSMERIRSNIIQDETIQGAINITNLFSDYAEGKRKIAKAITMQGVPTSDDDTMTQMAENIRQLYLPNESDYWKAFGYETETDFSYILRMSEAFSKLIDMWNTGGFINDPQAWVKSYQFGLRAFIICPKIDTSNVTNMSYMFGSCNSLQCIPQLDTSNVTDMSYMFSSCNSLQCIPQLDTSNVTNMSYMFNNCNLLRECKLSGLKISVNIRASSLLENDSILYIIENSAATKDITITLHAEAYERAVADASIQAALEAHPFVSLAKA